MITVDGSGRLIDLDLARDRNDVGARMSVRTVSCDVQKNLELHANQPLHISGNMAIYVDSVTA